MNMPGELGCNDPAIEIKWHEARQLARSRALFDRLKAVYNAIPEGRCTGCSTCCSESVSTFFIEWLQIVQMLEGSGRWLEALERAEAYAEKSLALPLPCPMLEPDGRCMIYDVRPLTCRMFGHLSKKDHANNCAAVLKSNRLAAEAIEQFYGVKLPIAVVERYIPFCQDFDLESSISVSKRDELADALFSLDSQFFAAGLLEADQIQLGLVDWFTLVRTDIELLSEKRIENVRVQNNFK